VEVARKEVFVKFDAMDMNYETKLQQEDRHTMEKLSGRMKENMMDNMR
jgi:hypothetical protein